MHGAESAVGGESDVVQVAEGAVVVVEAIELVGAALVAGGGTDDSDERPVVIVEPESLQPATESIITTLKAKLLTGRPLYSSIEYSSDWAMNSGARSSSTAAASGVACHLPPPSQLICVLTVHSSGAANVLSHTSG